MQCIIYVIIFKKEKEKTPEMIHSYVKRLHNTIVVDVSQNQDKKIKGLSFVCRPRTPRDTCCEKSTVKCNQSCLGSKAWFLLVNTNILCYLHLLLCYFNCQEIHKS